ncbi:MAG: mechanosensitive ion channel [Candidatus Peribacteraceae bacterium]|nr:mechanosensitive ion channel [Candidatus Peribacteraceae bacterium]MDD5739599.1 mechanosensitive ion channel [Candidatus Peribacteraceae bacterium]
MSRSHLHLWSRILLLCTLLFASVSAAAQSDIQRDVPRLQWRFDSLLKAKTPQTAGSIQENIEAERASIRSEFEKEFAKTVKELEESQTEPADLVQALDRERSIVDSINQQIDETKADLALLEKEESYYKDIQKSGTGSLPSDEILLTKSYPELLAKKAILEERLAVLQAFQKTQNDRLSTLKQEQQVRDIGVLFNILTYLAIFLAVFWVERLVRNLLLNHIRHRRVRYAATKAFTFVVYITLCFWFIQRIFSEHPGLSTIIALVGAALIIVLQDIIKGAVGWFGLKNSVSIGQRVAIGDMMGDVIDVGILYTTLIVSRSGHDDPMGQVGNIVRVPNQKILTDPFVNFHSTSDFENVEIPIRLRKLIQSDKAKNILEDILEKETGDFASQAQRQMDRRMRGYYFTQISPAPRVYMEVTSEGEIEFRLCFPAPIGRRRAVVTQITQEMLRRFAEEGIELVSTSSN